MLLLLLLLQWKKCCLNYGARQHRSNNEGENAEHDHFLEVIRAEILGFEPDF